MIRKATPKDIPAIIETIDSVLLENTDKNSGFLKSKNTPTRYKEIIEKSPYCYIATESGKIIGFLLAYPVSMIEPDNNIHRHIKEKYSKEDMIYVYQLAIHPGHQKKGYGTMLHKALKTESKSTDIILVVSKEPENKASEQFHTKLGFKKICVIRRKDGGSNTLYKSTQ